MSTTPLQHPNEPRSSDPPKLESTGTDRPTRRHHRMLLCGAFALGLAVGAGAFAVSGLAANQPAETQAAGVLVRSGSPHTSGREVVASWVEDHFGWVYVYDDGRVLSYTDGLHAVSREGVPMTGVIEHRLTPYGLELVASGVVHPRTLLITPLEDERGIWSDAAPTAFSPYGYAMCRLEGTDHVGVLKSVTDIEAQLPDFLRDVAHGAFTGDVGQWADATAKDAAFVGTHGDGNGDGIDCFSLTPSGANLMWNETHARQGDVDDTEVLAPNSTSFARLTLSDGSDVEFVFMPMLLHDGWVYWGG